MTKNTSFASVGIEKKLTVINKVKYTSFGLFMKTWNISAIFRRISRISTYYQNAVRPTRTQIRKSAYKNIYPYGFEIVLLYIA